LIADPRLAVRRKSAKLGGAWIASQHAMGDDFMICLYVSGVFYRLLVAVVRGIFGREHAYVFQESCIDRYQLALDMLIAAKKFSRFRV